MNSQWWYVAYRFCHTTPWAIRALFISGNTVIGAFKLNRIGKPIPEAPEPI